MELIKKMIIATMISVLLLNCFDVVMAKEIEKSDHTNNNTYKNFLQHMVLAEGEVAQYTVWDLDNDHVSELLVNISASPTDVGFVDVYTTNGIEVTKVACSQELLNGTSPEGRKSEIMCSNAGLVNIRSDSTSSEIDIYKFVLANNQFNDQQHMKGSENYANTILRYYSPTWHDIGDMGAFDSHRLLAEDQASFSNSVEDFWGSINKYELRKTKYLINDSKMQKMLKDKGDAFVGLRQIRPWNGACYGICVTTVLASLNMLDMQQFDKNANSFYEVSKPSSSPVIKDLMNYYQLLQYVPEIENSEIIINKSDDIPEYLAGLIKRSQSVENEGAVVFGLNWAVKPEGDPNTVQYKVADFWNRITGKIEGHEMIINGCSGGENGTDYVLELIDPNPSSSAHRYIKMVIPSDFRSFYLLDENGNEKSLDNWTEFSYYDSLDVFKNYNVELVDTPQI